MKIKTNIRAGQGGSTSGGGTSGGASGGGHNGGEVQVEVEAPPPPVVYYPAGTRCAGL